MYPSAENGFLRTVYGNFMLRLAQREPLRKGLKRRNNPSAPFARPFQQPLQNFYQQLQLPPQSTLPIGLRTHQKPLEEFCFGFLAPCTYTNFLIDSVKFLFRCSSGSEGRASSA